MKYYFDTEFVERPCTIDLISIGIVREDGLTLYLESNEVDLANVDPWIRENVLHHLTGRGIPRVEIRDAILAFVDDDPQPEFWAYFASYDWVVFCWLFGRMVDLPSHFPMFCRDFKQTMADHGILRHELPKQPEDCHNALADAKWLRSAVLAFAENP